ncbi:MAG: putative peptidoglycan lipid II flippase [Francisella sp.]|jgi:putative peptidoglycan lipid II flippase
MKKILSNSIVVSIFLFMSKILGFIRDLLLASFFGSSSALQAFLIAFRLPEFMRKVTTYGALTQVLNPHLEASVSDEQKSFIATILYFVAVVLLFITVLTIYFSSFWVDLYSYGLGNKSLLKLVNLLFVLMIPYVLFSFVVGLISAILNSHSRYIISSLLPLILNIVMIIGIVLSPYASVPIEAVAYSVLIAGILQFVIALKALYSLVGRLEFTKSVMSLKNSKAKEFLRKLPLSFLGSAMFQINSLIETFFASFLMSGSLAWLYYADRVNQFLYGIFGTAIATVMIPHLIEVYSDKKKLYDSLTWIIKVVLAVTIPAIVGLFVLSKPIVITLFYYGKFSLVDVLNTRIAILGYLVLLFCIVIARVVISALYVQNRSRPVYVVAMFSIVCNVIFDSFIVYNYASHDYAFAYLAIATSVISLLNLVVLLIVLADYSWSLFFRLYCSGVWLLKIALANLVMIVVLNMFNLSDDYWLSLEMFGRLKHILLVVFSGLISYVVMMWLLGAKKEIFHEYS